MQSPVPGFVRSMKALSAIITKAEAHCEAHKINPDVLFKDRLYPNMLPFAAQVQIMTDHAKGMGARLTGTENPVFEDNAATFGDLRDRLDRTIAFLESIPASAFEGAEDRTVTLKLASGPLDLPGWIYLQSSALPNFYFHMTTAYNILRHNGVEIGSRISSASPEWTSATASVTAPSGRLVWVLPVPACAVLASGSTKEDRAPT